MQSAPVSSNAPTLVADNQSTQVDPPRAGASSVGEAATLVAEGAGAAAAVRASGSSHRSTVLPRLELVGDAPRLVTDNRLRFEERGMLGRGGVGEVLLAHDNDIERPVAVKRLLPELQRPAMVGRFVEEIRTLGRLDHPNIVPVHDVGTDAEGRYYYVMKYVEGETLEDIIARLAAGDPDYHARYTLERRVQLFQAVLRAVQYAHAQGVIHRDLKPANVMVGRFGEVMLMDWGLARRLRDDHQAALEGELGRASQSPVSPKLRTMVGAILGTPAYMAPEQARGDTAAIDERADIYALCVMLHELLTLEHYLADLQGIAETLAAAQSRPVPDARGAKSPHQGPVPAEYGWFIARGVEKDPAARYRSVTEMIDQLQAIDEGKIPVQCMHTFMKRMSCEMAHGVDRNAPAVMMGTMLTLAAAAVGVGSLVWVFSR